MGAAEQKPSLAAATGKPCAETMWWCSLLCSSFCVSALRDDGRVSKPVGSGRKADKKVELAHDLHF